MWNIFENSWLLLTAAGVALVGASIYRQVKPEHGRKPLLVPLFLALLGLGFDAVVLTDYEAIEHIVKTCRKAALRSDHKTILHMVSPNYSDSFHASKAVLEATVEAVMQGVSLQKIKTQSHILTINGNAAQSQYEAAVHVGAENEYTKGVSLVFVGLELGFEKIGKQWFIRRVEVISVNFQPVNWRDVH